MICIGYDPKEVAAFAVARYSIRKFDRHVPIRGVVLNDLVERGLYYRPTKRKVNGDGRVEIIDELSIREDYDGRISTEHANSRFLVPHLVKSDWVLFIDSDTMFLRNPMRLFDLARKDKAVMCVKHDHKPDYDTKMEGQLQTVYERKNWSSVMLFNCEHPSNRRLTVDLINTIPGRDLHRFCWLEDYEIGALPPEWNYLVGHSKLENGTTPALVHFTKGVPDMAGYENQEYANEWRAMLPYAVGAL